MVSVQGRAQGNKAYAANRGHGSDALRGLLALVHGIALLAPRTTPFPFAQTTMTIANATLRP